MDTTLEKELYKAKRRIVDLYSKIRKLSNQTFTQVNSDWNATSGAAEILNKPASLSPITDAAVQLGQVTTGVPTVSHTYYNNTGGTFSLFRTGVGEYRVLNTADSNGNRSAHFSLNQRINTGDPVGILRQQSAGPSGILLHLIDGNSGLPIDLSGLVSANIDVFWRNNS